LKYSAAVAQTNQIKPERQREETHHESKFKTANQEDDYEEGGVERTH
jgi:hypothetical protein